MHEPVFQAGQEVESRSFQIGYRGAWFRCKIRGTRKKNNQTAHALEYFDYPDQKIGWIKLYQKPSPAVSKNKQLMMRPRFPATYRESEKPEINKILEEIVIIDDEWKVGDLVDWWTDGCYWSGIVTKVLGNGQVKIDLLPPPIGEGLSYDVFIKDLRPSLDWCPKNGWTVPLPEEGGNKHPCAQIVKPINSGTVLKNHAIDKIAKTIQPTIRTSPIRCDSSNSLDSLLDSPERSITTKNQSSTATEGVEFEVDGTRTGKTSCSESVSGSDIKLASTKRVGTTAIDELCDDKCPSKQMRGDRSICVNSMFSNTIEAAILDLEELVNRIKWIKGILQLGMPISATTQSSWEFSQQHAPCKPK